MAFHEVIQGVDGLRIVAAGKEQGCVAQLAQRELPLSSGDN
jgi:hypothetical protein